MTQTQQIPIAELDPRARLLSGLPVRERRYELSGVSTAVLEGGEGPPVVLLHGPGEHAGKWCRVFPELVKTRHVIAADLPGHGATQTTDGALDVDRTLAWLGELIERTCKEPPALVGQILGGAIAARFASRHGERLAALVLVDTLGLVPFQPAPQFMGALMAYMMQPSEATHDGLWQQCAFDLDRLRARLGETWDRLKAYNLDRAHAENLRIAREGIMQQFGMPAIPPAELAGISVSTTLVWGRHDLATPLEAAIAASERYGWPMQVIEDAGDDPVLEQPEAFLKVLMSALVER